MHFARNLLALIPRSHKDMVAALFRTIFAQPDRDAVSTAWEEIRGQLVKTFPKVPSSSTGRPADTGSCSKLGSPCTGLDARARGGIRTRG